MSPGLPVPPAPGAWLLCAAGSSPAGAHAVAPASVDSTALVGVDLAAISGVDSRWLFVGLIGLIALQRLAELRLSTRNARAALDRGAIEAGTGHYPWMVALHVAFLIVTPLEVWLLDRPFRPVLGLSMLAVLVAATGLRYWTIATLGDRWTTRVICEPGRPLVANGPYRFVRHPNYVAVIVELFAVPLVHSAWASALVFSGLNAVLLRVRIKAEEGTLADCARSREERVLLAVQALAHDRFGWQGRLEPDMLLVEDLGLDSMKALALAVEIENHFRIRIDEDSESELVRVGDLVQVIAAELGPL